MSDPSVASAPFDDFSLPSGGIILKSADGVEFKVYKNILALTSPVFRDMFTLPQIEEAEKDAAKEGGGGSDVVEVSESSSTLQALLRLIYPVIPPVMPGTSSDGTITDAKAFVDGVTPLLEAALKYDMALIVKDLCKKLVDGAETSLADGNVVDNTLALRVFVLACRHGLKNEARDAVHAALKGRVAGIFIPELRDITAAQYFYLIRHHNSAAQTAKNIVKIDADELPLPYRGMATCARCGVGPNKTAKWWDKFARDAHQLLSVSPRSTKVFTPSYIEELLTTSRTCFKSYNSYSHCESTRDNWGTVSQYIRELGEKIDRSISKVCAFRLPRSACHESLYLTIGHHLFGRILTNSSMQLRAVCLRM